MNADDDMEQIPANDCPSLLLARLCQRARMMASWATIWIIVGSIAGTFWALPQISSLMPERSVAFWLGRSFLPSFVSASMIALAIGMSADNGTDLVQRPRRFMLALMLGATCAAAAVSMIDWLMPVNSLWTMPRRMLDRWLSIMLFGALFGWAAVLYRRRIEDQTRLALLLGRRSLLARQVAEARLFAARAQIDPELVVRVLRDVRDYYRAKDDGAVALLDRLIGYLRLAMGRMREQKTSLSTELALMRAYIALREAETGARIELKFDAGSDTDWHDKPFSAPLFLLVRKMLEQMPAAATPVLHVRQCADQLIVELDSGVAAIPADRFEHLRESLRTLPASGMDVDILWHLSDSGTNRYVVQTAIN